MPSVSSCAKVEDHWFSDIVIDVSSQHLKQKFQIFDTKYIHIINDFSLVHYTVVFANTTHERTAKNTAKHETLVQNLIHTNQGTKD